MALMGIREYARHRNVAQSSVTDAIKSGRISDAVKFIGKNKNKKKIDQEMADQLWDENTVLNNKNSGDEEGDSSSTKSTQSSYLQAKAVRESYAARNEKLKYEKMAGRLVDADEVKTSAQNMAIALKDALLYLPDKLSPILAAETNIEKINEILNEELNSSLEAISRGDFNLPGDD